MIRILATITATLMLITLISGPSFAVADHCEKKLSSATHALSQDLGPREAESHEGECPMQHQACLHQLTILQRSSFESLVEPQFASLRSGHLDSFKKAPVLDGPFQPPRV